MDLDILKKQLEELDARFQQWIEPIERVHMISMYRVNKDGYTLANHEREVEEIAKIQMAQYDPYQDMYALLDQLCPIYLSADPQQRAEIRSAVIDKEGIWSGLINYVYRAAERLQSPAGQEWLRLGLAAVSIEDCSMDSRDTITALAELYMATEEAGIDPKPHFREVAELSNHQVPRGGTTPVSETLSKFHSYGVSREHWKLPQGFGDKETPWKRRIYHFEELGKYVEESSKGSSGESNRIPWWKRLLGLGK